VGTGGRGEWAARSFLREPDVQVVAVCDVDRQHLEKGRSIVDQHYENKDCAATRDFRELVARPDIDAVVVTTPDHWHALVAIAAANGGKDIYCEKPLANSVAEGRAICEAVRRNNRVLQTGSHERSGPRARFACELIRSGKIGRLQTMRVNLPCQDKHHLQIRQWSEVPLPEEIPEGFDYDLWLGHTPQVPFTSKRCHFYWRFILSYGGGEMTDRGAHVIDIGQLGAGTDETGPVEFQAIGLRSPGMFDALWDYHFINTYANGVKMIGEAHGPRGIRFEGTEGWIFVHIHGAKLEAEPASLLEENAGMLRVQLGRTESHIRNFLESVRNRNQPFAPAEIGHRTATICHLNNLAILLGRKLQWDPGNERVVGDDEANRLLTPVMRPPWSLSST
jgi:predicted dehydrogenase